MAEEELERFEITDWDIQNEFNPNRVRHKQSKQERIYGIWAEQDGDDDDGGEMASRPSFGGKSGKKNYTAPISFVSGGVRVVGENKDEERVRNAEDDNITDEEEDYIPVKPKTTKKQETRRHPPTMGASSQRFAGDTSANEIGSWERHTKGIGAKLLKQMGYQPGKGLGKKHDGIAVPVQAKLRKGKGAIGLYGSEHVNPPLRGESVPSAEGEGSSGAPTWQRTATAKKPALKPKYVYKTLEDVKKEGVLGGRPGSKSSHKDSALSNIKVIDMTGPEQRTLSGYHQLASQHSRPQEDAPEVKGVAKAQIFAAHFELPELEHNLELLIDSTRSQILRNDQSMKHESNRLVNLEHERSRIGKNLDGRETLSQSMKTVASIVETLLERSQSGTKHPLTLDDLQASFRILIDEYRDHYVAFGLSDLVQTLLIPLMRNQMSLWRPLEEPMYSSDIYKQWKILLERGVTPGSEIDPYYSLVWETWMPLVRQSVFSWSPRRCEPLVNLLEHWEPLVPPYIFSNVLEQYVLPRIQQEVEMWNPLTDTVPIHTWIHPWLPLMHDRLEIVYAPIRFKLANALTSWHPSDGSAKLILRPWHGVFSPGTLEAFVVQHIIPKLALALQSFQVNPAQQNLDCWHWVISWEDLCPAVAMASLLEKNFFPQWLRVLYQWLTSSNANFEEISRWYSGWKEKIPKEILSQTNVREQFRTALDMMNRAVSGQQIPPPPTMAYPMRPQNTFEAPPTTGVPSDLSRSDMINFGVPPPPPPPPLPTDAPPSYGGVPPPPPPPEMPPTYPSGGVCAPSTMRSAYVSATAACAAGGNISFKELIERRAAERNVIFMPVPNRYYEGKQVYRLGSTLLYMDRTVLFVHNGKTWVPTSLQSLLDSAAC